MKKSQLNKLSMYTAVHGALNNNASKWNTNEAISRMVANFNKLYEELKATLTVQSTATPPITQNKQFLKAQMIEEILVMTGFLNVVASDLRDVELQARLKFHRSDLIQLHQLDLINFAERFVVIVKSHEEELKTIGVTEDGIAECYHSVTDFVSFSSAPRNAIDFRVTVTEKIPDLIRQIDEFLKYCLDRTIRKAGAGDAEFINLYNQKRKLAKVISTKSNTDEISPPGDEGVNFG